MFHFPRLNSKNTCRLVKLSCDVVENSDKFATWPKDTRDPFVITHIKNSLKQSYQKFIIFTVFFAEFLKLLIIPDIPDKVATLVPLHWKVQVKADYTMMCKRESSHQHH